MGKAPGLSGGSHGDGEAGDAAGPQARLVALARERGVSLSALSGMIGRNAAYLQQFVRKGSPRKLEENDRRTLAMFFGVDESELGAPAANEVAVVQSGGRLAFARNGSARSASRPVEAEWVDIPRLALGASAGPGTLALDEAESGRLRFSQRWLRTLGLDPGQLSVIEVAGDSMEPTLHDGDEILVDRSPRPWRDGIHVVRIDEVLLVKRLETGPAGTIRVMSDNPAYPRIERAYEDVAIIGRVVWKGGRI
ncbi:putative phage repressor [Novosphingobium nitrogenifigens DSM 19370]|uniref:Putative phage repressor n=1 Tax=Novosphingobium nitrogenifigens DSM 19370 TaxID=983920 RepID=F1Z8P3_9SPHN|nr:S24 family peptidase [Novosphingobium nitrogenifigens]EGD58982.1 putative phage repressor [Novosphingobium nitrogenifigens DSM 19370]